MGVVFQQLRESLFGLRNHVEQLVLLGDYNQNLQLAESGLLGDELVPLLEVGLLVVDHKPVQLLLFYDYLFLQLLSRFLDEKVVEFRVKLVLLVRSDAGQGAFLLKLVQTDSDDVLLELVLHELVLAVHVHIVVEIVSPLDLLRLRIGDVAQFGAFLPDLSLYW